MLSEFKHYNQTSQHTVSSVADTASLCPLPLAITSKNVLQLWWAHAPFPHYEFTLSAVRYFLLYTGASVSCLCSERLTAMLRGVEKTSGGRTSTRIGLTSADLGTIHNYIVISNISVVDCTMLWAAVSVGFHGLLRSSEILAPSSSTTEDRHTLATTVTIQLKWTEITQNGDGRLSSTDISVILAWKG